MSSINVGPYMRSIQMTTETVGAEVSHVRYIFSSDSRFEKSVTTVN